jgi:Flp pilus assembly protein TadD
VAYAELGDLQGAVDAYGEGYRRARGRPAEEAHALHNTGVVLTLVGDLEGAERVLRAAVQRAPRGADMAYALAHVLWRKGDLAGAETLANRALELRPGRAPPHHLLGMVSLDGGQVEAALARFEEAARLAPEDGGIRADLGLGLHRAGRGPEACAAWDAALLLRAEEERHLQTRRWMASAGCNGRGGLGPGPTAPP